MNNKFNAKFVLILSAIVLMSTGCAAKDNAPVVETVTPVVQTATVMSAYELQAFRNAIDTIESDYANHGVLNASLVNAMTEMTRLNSWLLVNDCDNLSDVKVAVAKADQIVINLDLTDPLIHADDLTKATVSVSDLRKSIDQALSTLKMTNAKAQVSRVMASESLVGGEVGNILSLKATVYPASAVASARYEWSTADANIATVTDGSILIVGVGETRVKVTEVASGKTAEVSVIGKAVATPIKAPVTAPADKGVVTPKATPKAGGGAEYKDAKVGDVLEGGGEVIGHLETGDGSMYDGIPITKGSRGTIMSDEYAQEMLDKMKNLD